MRRESIEVLNEVPFTGTKKRVNFDPRFAIVVPGGAIDDTGRAWTFAGDARKVRPAGGGGPAALMGSVESVHDSGYPMTGSLVELHPEDGSRYAIYPRYPD